MAGYTSMPDREEGIIKGAKPEKLWENLGSASWGALNSALFDIPDYIARKVAPSETYKALQDFVARNKGSYTAGQIVGLLAPTGGAAAKVAGRGLKAAKGLLTATKMTKLAAATGKGAKALDTAADIIRGTKSSSGVVRGLVTGAEQAVPRALMELGEGGDLRDVSTRAITGTLTSGALGGLVSGSGKGLKKAAALLREKAPRLTAEVSELAEKSILNRIGITKPILKRAITGVETDLDEAAAHKGAELLHRYGSDVRSAITSTLRDNKATAPLAFKAFVNQANEMSDGIKGIARLVKASNPDVSDEVADIAARTMRNAIDLGDIDVGEAKGLLSGGAKVAGSLIAGQALGGSSVIKKLQEGESISVDDIVGDLAKFGGPAAVMRLSPRVMASLASRVKDINRGGVPELTKTLSLIEEISPRYAMRLKSLEMLGAKAAVAQAPKLSKAGEFLTKNKETLGKIAMKAAPVLLAKRSEEITEAEAEVGAEAVDAARTELSGVYQDKILNSLRDAWIAKYAARGVDFADFYRAVAERTDNFDPKKAAPVIFPDSGEREKFLRDYEIALRVKDIDIEEAYKGKGANIASELLTGKSAAAQRASYTELVDTISSMLAAEKGLPSPAEKKAVEDDLTAIMKLPAKMGDKKTLLMELLGSPKYNLSMTNLRDLGLI